MSRGSALRSRFILLVSAAVAIFLAAILVATLAVVRDHARSQADELSALILEQAGGRIDRFFGEIEELAESLASWGPVARVEVPAMRELFIASVLARKDYLRAIYLGGSDGAMHEWGEGAEFIDHEPTFPPGYDPRRRPWYAAALAADGFAVSPPYRFASVAALGISCSIPVRDASGRLVGVLGLDLLLENLAVMLEGIGVPRGGRAMLLTAAGEVVASQFASYGSGSDRGRSLELEPSGIPGVAERLKAGAAPFTAEYRGAITLFAAAKAGRAPLYLVIALPYASVMGPVVRLMSVVTVLELILLAALVASLGAIANSLILAPLRHIVGVVNEIEAGGKNARVRLETGDEFAILGGELNSLLDAVADASARLEDKVRERTEELARLQVENTRLGIAEERKRISRDIHDSLGARLTNIFFCANVARSVAARDPGRLAELLDDIESNCLNAVKNVKDIIGGMAEDERLRGDFARLLVMGIRRGLAAGGIRLRARVEGKEALNALDAPTRVELERIVLELTSNALKHSRAARVSFSLALRGGADGAGRILMRFSDDGRGFDVEAARRSGFGLSSVAWRVGRLGGKTRLESSPGAGTDWRFELPVPAATATEAAAAEAAS